MRFGKTTTFIALGAGLMAGFLGGVVASQTSAATAADTTIAPCSAYADTSHPHFDGPVVPDVCVTDTGAISVPDATDTLIPRCVNDDFNDGTQALCWTQRVTDMKVLVIDRSDTVVSTR